MIGRLLLLLLRVLPVHAISRAAGALANAPVPRPLRPAVYRGYARVFGADASEAELALDAYPSINAFFTRALKPGRRPVAPHALVSPADAAIGAAGPVTNGTLIQAKGRTYELATLLGDPALAERMAGGTFATLYLAPKDYHRLHFPIDGAVTAATYVPGALWPVNVLAVTHVESLFAVNERIVLTMRARGTGGMVAAVLVGATMVGMTRLAFDPSIHTNARRREVQRKTYEPPVEIRAGEPLGHFEFGSTIILVCAPDAAVLELEAGRVVRMGERIGRLAPAADG